MTGERDIRQKQVVDAIEDIRQRASAVERFTWIYCNDRDYAGPMIEAGWDIVTIGSDVAWLAAGARGDRAPS